MLPWVFENDVDFLMGMANILPMPDSNDNGDEPQDLNELQPSPRAERLAGHILDRGEEEYIGLRAVREVEHAAAINKKPSSRLPPVVAFDDRPEVFRVVLLSEHGRIPTQAHDGDVGLDLYAAEDVLIPVGKYVAVNLDIAVAIPRGYSGDVRPRSGLAFRHGITVLNAPGTVDPGYRGPMKVCLVNHGDIPYRVKRGHRIAQLVLTLVGTRPPIRVGEFEPTERGDAGYGSSGA